MQDALQESCHHFYPALQIFTELGSLAAPHLGDLVSILQLDFGWHQDLDDFCESSVNVIQEISQLQAAAVKALIRLSPHLQSDHIHTLNQLEFTPPYANEWNEPVVARKITDPILSDQLRVLGLVCYKEVPRARDEVTSSVPGAVPIWAQ